MEPIGAVRVGNATKPCKITRVGEGRRERIRGGTKVEREREKEREREREREKEKKGKEKLETRLLLLLLAGTAGGWNVG